MKESYWGYGLIMLGIFIVAIMILINSTTTNSTKDYYAIKEVTQASMIDAVDFAYYRLFHNVKMSEQKFVENFVRRFAETANLSNKYDIEFFDLYEVPPKVSVKVTTKSDTQNVANQNTSFDVVNTIDAILEWKVPDNTPTVSEMKCPVYINFSFANDLKDPDNDLKDKYPELRRVYEKWLNKDSSLSNCSPTQCTPLKEAFEEVFGELSNMTGAEMERNTTLMYLKDKGYITIK